MKQHHVGIIMNGVTGRMGTNQHLIRSILAIRKEGGVKLANGDVIVPDPILVGRNADKLQQLARTHDVSRFTTDLSAALKDPSNQIYFDSQTTDRRATAVRQAIAARKAIYCEKPTAVDVDTALALFRECQAAGLKNGVVQDKLWLPGLRKLKLLIDSGFFGKILSVRGEFGYWVFEGDLQPAQRPSWNYRKEDGGGIVIDMLCHWRYVIDNLFGNVTAVSCLAATHVPERIDERGQRYACTADDSAYATFETDQGILLHFNSSWCVRVRRDDLLTLQVDGTKGSAVAGLRECWTQRAETTPRPIWNPDVPQPIDFYAGWQKVPDPMPYDNAFKVQWEMFLKHVVADEPFRWSLLEGAKGVQLAELGLESSAKRQWVKLPPLG
ncbi:Gfo/Idh/MocA family oxidoreductase [Opitutus sp. ER46]|uniref:Gfo/Idh/MocA family protein n=1 Tax=Opitutus sp. ER46 TaxID=2161864 RepID=UPI000D320AC0|nr:Gfo/Idh/MocA family oxidoreductase [Opitutus sp. ER46]PTX94494.1 oxidoreductase [Opitutus sp. ER46]